MRDAVALDRAGVACIYLEGIPREVAAMITAEVETPTIGIGAGPDCDGQVLVFHDILNLTFGPPAKFVRRYGDAAALHHAMRCRRFAPTWLARQYPSDAESYHLPKETRGGAGNRAGAQAGDEAIDDSNEILWRLGALDDSCRCAGFLFCQLPMASDPRPLEASASARIQAIPAPSPEKYRGMIGCQGLAKPLPDYQGGRRCPARSR